MIYLRVMQSALRAYNAEADLDIKERLKAEIYKLRETYEEMKKIYGANSLT